MNIYRLKNEKTAALCGMIWFATIIDACFTWFFPGIICAIIGLSFVIYATILLNQNNSLILTNQRLKLFALFFCFFSFILIPHASLPLFISSILKFCPFFCLIFWPRSVLAKFYTYLKNFVVFYAVVSIIVELLVLSGLWKELPYYVFPAQDNVQELNNTVNHHYGLFVIPTRGNDLVFYRAMGPLREGGHFSVFLGFIYLIEKAVYNKRNAIIIVAGFLTLSPNFLFYFMIAEGYGAIKGKYFVKSAVGVVSVIILVGGVIFFSPDFIKDEIVRIVFERSLEENLQAAETDGYMALLDGRTNMIGLQMWNHFVNHADILTQLIGVDNADIKDLYVLSDFRILIIRYGYIGFSLILICSFAISFCYKRSLYGMFVLLMGLWVMTSRAWMFNQFYIWTMMLLAVNTKVVQDKINPYQKIKRIEQ